jgi:hypothetical protein
MSLRFVGKPTDTHSQILEGLITFIIAIWAYFQVHNYPDTAKFINDEERIEIYRRLREDCNGLAEEWHLKYVRQAFTDWKIWVHMLITFGSSRGAPWFRRLTKKQVQPYRFGASACSYPLS